MSLTVLTAAAGLLLMVWPFGKDEPEEAQTSGSPPPSPHAPPAAGPPAEAIVPRPVESPDETVDFAERGIELVMLGKPDRAAESFCRALQRDPSNGTTLYNLAMVMEDLGRADEACAYYASAIEAEPDSADIRSNYGVALLNSGAVSGAVEQLSRAAALTPNDATIQFNLGCAQQRNGDIYEAVACFRQALRLDSQDLQCRFNLAVCLAGLGHRELTVRELKVFISQASERYPEQVACANEMLDSLPRNR